MPGPLLVAAAGFPPTVSGSAILSRNLWSAWHDPAGLVVVTYCVPAMRTDAALTVRGIRLKTIEPWPFRHPLVAAQLDPLAARAVERALLAEAAEVRPRAVWVNWPTTAFTLGAWRAARRLGLPLYVHLHDTWQEAYRGRPLPLERFAAWRHEARVLKDAARVFVITDEARAWYREKHGIDATVLPHTVPAEDLRREAPPRDPAAPETVLHFAGNVYRTMNADALAVAARATERTRHPAVLEVFSPTDARRLAALGVSGPRVRARFASRAEVMAAQAASDVMVLPLAFGSHNPVEIRTVFPTKLLEYLVSGRPIVVVGPPDSWAAVHARAEGWGEVVDRPDPAALAATIDALRADPARRAALVSAARAEAERRSAPAVAAALRPLVA